MKMLLLATAASAFLTLPAFAQYSATPAPAPMQPAQPAPMQPSAAPMMQPGAPMQPGAAAPMQPAGTMAQTMRPTGPGSSEVRHIQARLNRDGFGAGPADGIMGPRTRTALGSFQRSRGIAPTGRVNHQTLADLYARRTPMGSTHYQPPVAYRSPGAMMPPPKPMP